MLQGEGWRVVHMFSADLHRAQAPRYPMEAICEPQIPTEFGAILVEGFSKQTASILSWLMQTHQLWGTLQFFFKPRVGIEYGSYQRRQWMGLLCWTLWYLWIILCTDLTMPQVCYIWCFCQGNSRTLVQQSS